VRLVPQARPRTVELVGDGLLTLPGAGIQISPGMLPVALVVPFSRTGRLPAKTSKYPGISVNSNTRRLDE
jgi:hypothetical protein